MEKYSKCRYCGKNSYYCNCETDPRYIGEEF